MNEEILPTSIYKYASFVPSIEVQVHLSTIRRTNTVIQNPCKIQTTQRGHSLFNRRKFTSKIVQMFIIKCVKTRTLNPLEKKVRFVFFYVLK